MLQWGDKSSTLILKIPLTVMEGCFLISWFQLWRTGRCLCFCLSLLLFVINCVYLNLQHNAFSYFVLTWMAKIDVTLQRCILTCSRGFMWVWMKELQIEESPGSPEVENGWRIAWAVEGLQQGRCAPTGFCRVCRLLSLKIILWDQSMQWGGRGDSASDHLSRGLSIFPVMLYWVIHSPL